MNIEQSTCLDSYKLINKLIKHGVYLIDID